MKTCMILALILTVIAAPAIAKDKDYKLPFAEVLAMPEAKQQLDGSVKFFLAGQETPKVLRRIGEDVSNKKTNGFGKDDGTACRWAALSALKAFQDSAKSMGANAVIDMVSYYKKVTFSSPTEYQCVAGSVIVGVALKGTYAKIGE